MNFSDFTDDVVRSVGFLSRIPMPGRFFAGHDGSLSRAVRAFPVAGLLIALPPSALLALLLACRTDPLLAALLALALQTMLTGALHEDGLSDTADGIGGGRDREAILRIMKDSRIGSFGALALMLVTLASWSALAALLARGAHWPALVAAAALSRAPMVALMAALPPARPGGLSAATGRPAPVVALLAVLAACLLAMLLLGPVALSALLGAAAVSALLALAAQRLIGGQTGDILGASQQLAFAASLSLIA